MDLHCQIMRVRRLAPKAICRFSEVVGRSQDTGSYDRQPAGQRFENNNRKALVMIGREHENIAVCVTARRLILTNVSDKTYMSGKVETLREPFRLGTLRAIAKAK